MMTPEEKDKLLARALTEDLTPEEVAQLAAACREDAALLTELSRYTVIERLLSHLHLYPNPQSFASEVTGRLQSRATQPATFVKRVTWRLRWRRWVPWPAWPAFAAFAALALVLAYWGVVNFQTVARVERVEAATWPTEQRGLAVGENLRRGKIAITSGFLELRLASGVHLIVEGPTTLELQRQNRCFLHQGRAVARVPEKARGFILDSPRGRLIDLGTEFGVTVAGDGETEVHVLKGVVEAKPSSQSATVRLTEKEAVRLDIDAVERMPSNPLEFVTDLPARTTGPIGFVHWSFDEGEGNVAHNLGEGLGPSNSDAVLHSYNSYSKGPLWITGQFGNGLYLDGDGAYLESAFTGVSGDHPRTVAFWLKVPRNLSVDQGYGIINWGSLTGPGAAWQISVNPTAMEGPIGRLRVGVYQGPVVGVTDLRDDRWHHCAIVMYGGHRPDTSTHVLLYLDGELEPAANKAVREIKTDTDSESAHGIWMGRPLSVMPGKNTKDRFFRGWLDEVFIFDQALSQEQIRQLMKDNRLATMPGAL